MKKAIFEILKLKLAFIKRGQNIQPFPGLKISLSSLSFEIYKTYATPACYW